MSRSPGIWAASRARSGELLTSDAVKQTLTEALAGAFPQARVLVLIPDHTRSIPLPTLFPLVVECLRDAAQIDFMVALGTHPPLTEAQLLHLVGLTPEQRREKYRHVRLLNHRWNDAGALLQIGTISAAEVRKLAGDAWHPSLGGDVPVHINKKILEYDRIVILGPTFPHEVAGFSGGAKYLFPGISGPEMIDVTHWLGALIGVRNTIGIRNTPVRAMIHTAAAKVPTPVTLVSMVVTHDGIAGLFVGDIRDAWEAAAALSAERHIVWCERPFRRVLSWAPPMYDELWTAAKAMYKLDPVVADGGELIIFAPHLEIISRAHGAYIEAIGYHVLAYFLAQWERFREIPLGVLAHSTHVRGEGRFVDGVESPRIDVKLASRLPAEVCTRLGLGYVDPRAIDLLAWQGAQDDDLLFVPKAGEMLYRLRDEASTAPWHEPNKEEA